MTNSADPDQLASSEANWSGSTMFAKIGHVVFSKKRFKMLYKVTDYEVIFIFYLTLIVSNNIWPGVYQVKAIGVTWFANSKFQGQPAHSYSPMKVIIH